MGAVVDEVRAMEAAVTAVVARVVAVTVGVLEAVAAQMVTKVA